MWVYTCNSFTGHYPVGTAAVIVATDKYHALDILQEQLIELNLPQDNLTINDIKSVSLDKEQVIILCDGNY